MKIMVESITKPSKGDFLIWIGFLEELKMSRLVVKGDKLI